jgi:hypothetical protein
MRKSLAKIGEPAHVPFGFRAAFSNRTPKSVRVAIEGMSDPDVAGWNEVGVALAVKGTDDSEEAKGVATDGVRWFVSSNGIKRVVVYEDSRQVAAFSPTQETLDKMWKDAGQPDRHGLFEQLEAALRRARIL